jgi:hypothetical protein
MSLSAVAGILDTKGGLRVVVTQRFRMRHHIGKGERLFVVPGYEVEEPVPWDDIPELIERVKKHVQQQLAPDNRCGGCNLCCILPSVNEIKKPEYTVCHFCSVEWGCLKYNTRPKSCRNFSCMWLKSQDRNDRMGPQLRPDRCGAFFTENSKADDPLVFEVHGEPNAVAWAWIDEMQRVGYLARKIVGYDK